MKLIMLILIILSVQIFSTGVVAAGSPRMEVRLSTKNVPQGDLGFIRCRIEGEGTPHMVWMKREIPLVADSDKALWYGFFGADLLLKPGKYPLVVSTGQSSFDKKFSIMVTAKEYGVRKLVLPKKMVDLDSKTLKRVRKESQIMKGLWKASNLMPFWRGQFIKPVSGAVKGTFGRRSIINNQPRSPHSGVDLKGKRGSPVRVTNNGRVVFVGDHFFTGLTVVLDHGGGIQSMYFHLDKVFVHKEQILKRGDILGHVGSTGRATGPHLHWGMRVNGARIDPIRLTALSKQLEG